MIPGCIKGANLRLQPPPSMEGCKPLMVRREGFNGSSTLTSAWLPSPQELALLNAGYAVHLTIYGEGHPPVWLAVGENG